MLNILCKVSILCSFCDGKFSVTNSRRKQINLAVNVGSSFSIFGFHFPERFFFRFSEKNSWIFKDFSMFIDLNFKTMTLSIKVATACLNNNLIRRFFIVVIQNFHFSDNLGNEKINNFSFSVFSIFRKKKNLTSASTD